MTTWAQIVDGRACDVLVGDSLGSLVAPGFDPNRVGWTEVPEGTVSGAVQQQDGTFLNPTLATQLPNNPGNPYFGKLPKTPKDFWDLVTAVYIAIASGSDPQTKQTNGLTRLGRLLTSKVAAAIIKVADSVELIDPDDKTGQFLAMAALLMTTNHEDGQLLMTPQEFAAIMGAWKSA